MNFERNRDILQLEGQRSIVEHQISMERAAYLPSLSAFGNFNYQGQGDDLRFWDYNWAESAAIGLRLTIPIFTGGRRQRIEQAELDRVQVDLQREFAIESLRSRHQTTTRRMTEFEAMLEAQERNIAQAERGFAIARASYEEGVHTLMDVNDAERALTEARLNYSTTLAEYINAVLDLQDLVGGQ